MPTPNIGEPSVFDGRLPIQSYLILETDTDGTNNKGMFKSKFQPNLRQRNYITMGATFGS